MQALSLSVHIPLVCFGIAFPVLVLFAEYRYLRTGDELYRTLARRWSRIMLALFAVGVVTGLRQPLRDWWRGRGCWCSRTRTGRIWSVWSASSFAPLPSSGWPLWETFNRDSLIPRVNSRHAEVGVRFSDHEAFFPGEGF
jgi:hypothetical protein